MDLLLNERLDDMAQYADLDIVYVRNEYDGTYEDDWKKIDRINRVIHYEMHNPIKYINIIFFNQI